MRTLVVEVKEVGSSLSDVQQYLDERAAEGWRLVAVDNGVIYMEHDGTTRRVTR